MGAASWRKALKDVYHPIIYIRGYAMTETERNETAADPFCGFNVGSTVFRAKPQKTENADRFVFESPVLRLVTDFGYRHVYQNGSDIMDPDWQPPLDENGDPTQGIPAQSIIIYRYYDDGSQFFGNGQPRDIRSYAAGLGELILKVRDLVCSHGATPVKPEDFKCYLVAHSMGGLVARAFLQNPALGHADARKSVDKFFTFATPHNGIDVAGINVPSWLTPAEANTFSRPEMANYLALQPVNDRVDFMPESVLPADRIFCMVGTNRGDYEVLKGIVRAFVGHGSDGLVRVENATLWGIDAQNRIRPAATAYAYRSHSGYFGIVNSEEAYQNLVRFLFGDVRVDIWLDVDQVALPEALESSAADVDALYQFELLAAPRGKRWYLSRRVAEEDSPACRTHQELTRPDLADRRAIYLSTVFLANRARVDPNRRTLAYAMTVAAKVPDYRVNKKFWPDQHYEGGDIFRDTAIIEMTPPRKGAVSWTVKFGWMSKSDGVATRTLTYEDLQDPGQRQFEIPFSAKRKPGISGRIRLIVSPWNT
jgi:hypothetical protein